MKHQERNSNDDQALGTLIKVGGWLLSGTAAIAIGVIQAVGEVIDSSTDL